MAELQIEDTEIGKGKACKAGDFVSMHYTGWLTNGKKFDFAKTYSGNLFIIYFTLTFFSSIDFYIAEKIFELTKCENKSLRELPCKKDFKQCRSVQ
jgi:hypothetical protein